MDDEPDNAITRRKLSLLVNQIRALELKYWGYIVLLMLSIVNTYWLTTPDLYPQLFSIDVLNRAAKVYISLIIFEGIGFLALLIYFATAFVEMKTVPAVKEGIHELDADFLTRRADNLDREVHYHRSGVSILAGVFTGVIVLLLNNETLSEVQSSIIVLCSILVFFSIISIFLSFSNTGVYVEGSRLKEHLLPEHVTETIYRKQLRGVVELKHDKITKMRTSVTVGLLLFIIYGAIIAANPILEATPYEELAWFKIVFNMFYMLLSSFFAVGVVIELGLLGMHVLPEYPDSTETDTND